METESEMSSYLTVPQQRGIGDRYYDSDIKRSDNSEIRRKKNVENDSDDDVKESEDQVKLSAPFSASASKRNINHTIERCKVRTVFMS